MQEGVNTRLIDQIWLVGEIVHLITETKTKNVLFLGDMYNSFAYSLPKNVYQAAYYFVKAISQVANLYLLVGNHDIHMGRHLFGLYEDMSNVKVVSKPLLNFLMEGHTVDMIPYGYEIPSPSRRADILVGHLEVAGAVMNAAGTKTPEGISVNSLEGYDYVFLGHYHEFQQLNVPHAQWAGYIGSVMQIDLGSSPFNKGIVLFDNDQTTQLTLNSSPRIFTRTIQTQRDADVLVEEIKGGKDYWRVTVKEAGIKFPLFDHHVQVEYDIVPKVETRLEVKPGERLEDTVERFIRTADTKVDKDLSIELAKEMMK